MHISIRIRVVDALCGVKCHGYDYKSARESSWSAPDINGVPVYIWYRPQRIQCKEHGVHTEIIPWADEHSRFTKDLNNEIAFMALTCPKTVVCQYFGINWRTVENGLMMKSQFQQSRYIISAEV